MNETLGRKKKMLQLALAHVREKFPEMNTLCKKLNDDLEEFDLCHINYNEFKQICINILTDSSLCVHISPQYDAVHSQIEKAFYQFFHLHDWYKVASTGKKMYAQDIQRNMLFKKPETKDDIARHFDDCIAYIEALNQSKSQYSDIYNPNKAYDSDIDDE